MNNSSYRIGVDGGGTKTDLILVDAEGNVVARHTAPGCSPSHLGPAARKVLTDALGALLADSSVSRVEGCITHTLLCMAGSPAFWQETAAELKTFGQVSTTTDAAPVLELAVGGEAGAVLHAGTGSFVAARTRDGNLHYAGGLGWKLGDPGSGIDIGRRGAALGVLELQGWMPATALGRALQAHSGLEDARAISRLIYNDPAANARLAAFAPRVIELATGGCSPAQSALIASLSDLVDLAKAVTEKLFDDAPMLCGVSGSLLGSAPAAAALRALADARHWRVGFKFLVDPPIEGVRRLLVRGS